MTALEVKNLSKNFGELQVLKDISFNVEQGQVVAVIGPSGSGKSTLLRCINQLERADGGEINVCSMNMVRTVNNKAVYAPSKTLREIRLKIGLVFQNFNLFPHMSVMQNIIEAPVHVLKKSKKDAVSEAEVLLEKMGLSEKAAAYPCELSGGQQQRVSIARALALKPEVFFFRRAYFGFGSGAYRGDIKGDQGACGGKDDNGHSNSRNGVRKRCC